MAIRFSQVLLLAVFVVALFSFMSSVVVSKIVFGTATNVTELEVVGLYYVKASLWALGVMFAVCFVLGFLVVRRFYSKR